jgi:large subunit ribosomal protein L35
MPKIKTHKASAKRYTFTKKGKILHRKSGQGHFNARESSNTTRNKRRDVSASPSFERNIRRLNPYA